LIRLFSSTNQWAYINVYAVDEDGVNSRIGDSMPTKWTDLFLELLQAANISCKVTNRVNGWSETAIINGSRCFMKSATYDKSRRHYFQGIDQKKLEESGDLVVLCGGYGDSLRDIFLIPWKEFFKVISQGKAINTYRLPRVYFQYKFKVHETDDGWTLSVQGAARPTKVISQWHNSPSASVHVLK